MVWLLVEGKEGVANFDEILKVPGIDAIMMGPFDLSQSLGVLGEVNHPLVLETLNTMVKKAKARNIAMIAVLVSESTTEQIQASACKWKAMGVELMMVGSDRRELMAEFRRRLGDARAAVAGAAKK
jgi:4-hydroxy-2-oxoheptanedioate aldolase